MKSPLIARFTPSLMAPADLEAIFVQRENLAQRLVEQIRESVLTPAKHHNLLIGPRGIGKSHLTTLVVNRVVAQADIRERMIIAWLREEEWGVMSFLDLLLRILRAVSEESGVSIPQERLDAIHDAPASQAEKLAVRLARDVIADKTLFIIIENLDDIFNGLALREQRAFRAFLQEKASVTTLATSPGLFAGASVQTSPFYGFFNVHHLSELSFEDAVLLLEKIATSRGQLDLAQFLRTPAGRARVRAIDHLAHGNPRVYIILSEFLTVQSLDDLVDPVLRMLDDLTPYYQSRILSISMQQRKIIEFLADHRSPAVVKEIARRCFMTQQTASGQLKKLTEWGYVVSEHLGRESYYELREPLMRFCMDLKKQRKEPLRPLVEILRIWWTPDQLEEQLTRLPIETSITGKYLAEALARCRKETTDPRIEACQKAYERYADQEQWEDALKVAEEKVAISQNEFDVADVGVCLINLGRYQQAAVEIDQALSVAPGFWPLQVLEAACASHLQDFEKVIRATEELVDKKPFRFEMLRLRSTALLALGRFDQAVRVSSVYLKTRPEDGVMWALKAAALMMEKKWEEAEVAARKTLELRPQDASATLILGTALYQQSRGEEALPILHRLHELGDPSGTALFSRARILADLERWSEALAELERALTDKSSKSKDSSSTTFQILLDAFLKMDRAGFQSYFADISSLLRTHAVPSLTMERFLLRVISSDSQDQKDRPANKTDRLNVALDQIARTKSDDVVIRLLFALREFNKTGDRAVLLQLPLEERTLVEPWLRSGEDTDKSPKK
jgi:tetratricopeptide (TPR) repeat protein